MPEPKNWNAWASQTAASLRIDRTIKGPFEIGTWVEAKPNLPKNAHARHMHTDEAYKVEGYNRTGGVLLWGYVWPVSARHIQPSDKPRRAQARMPTHIE